MARSGNFINFREVSARLLLRPGRYIVVPSTYDPGYGGDYMLRVLEEHEWGILRQPVIDTHAVQVFMFHKQKYTKKMVFYIETNYYSKSIRE